MANIHGPGVPDSLERRGDELPPERLKRRRLDPGPPPLPLPVPSILSSSEPEPLPVPMLDPSRFSPPPRPSRSPSLTLQSSTGFFDFLALIPRDFPRSSSLRKSPCATLLSSGTGHYSGLHINPELSNQKLALLALRINNLKPHEIMQFKTQSIGSFGENAFIHKLTIDGMSIVVKVQKTGHERKREFEIANWLSSRYEQNFIRTIASKSEEDGATSPLIFMELAVGDLSQIIEGGLTSEEFDNYINDVFDALIILAREGICHKDLHAKNIFVVRENTKNKAKIADFGESKRSEFLTSNLDDLEKFMLSVRKHIQDTSLSHYTEKLKLFQNIYNSVWQPLETKGTPWSSREAEELMIRMKDAWNRLTTPEIKPSVPFFEEEEEEFY